MGTGNLDHGTAVSAVHFQNVNTDGLTHSVLFAGDLLADAEHSIILLITLADADEDITGRIQTQDSTQQQLLALGGVAVIDHTALCLTDALDDYLLGGLGSNAAELVKVDRDGDGIANLCAGVDIAGGIDVDLHSGVLHFFHGGLGQGQEQTLLTQIYHHIFSGDIAMVFPVLAVCAGQRLLQTLHHVLHGNTLDFFQFTQACEDLCTDIDLRCGLLLGLCGSCHFVFPPLCVKKR